MSISVDDLKYRLVRGLDIPYNNIKIRQPKIEDIDTLGINYYSSMSYVFCIQKEHLPLWDTLQNEFNSKTLFQSLFIQEKFYETNNKLDSSTSILILLRESLKFFLGIEDVKKIIIDIENERFIVVETQIRGEESFLEPIFVLDNNNFEEFSELIRLITWNEVYKIKKDEIKRVLYADESIQKIYDNLIKQHLKEEEKKKQENNISISDIIGAICINENTKYNYKNINELTIWQLFYQSKSMFDKEHTEIIKMQYTSGNFTFEKPPDLDWLKKVKISLPKDSKLIN